MRGLLLLLGVGAAIYTFLVVTHDALPGDRADDTLAGQTQSDHPVAEHLSSWGSYLAPSPSQNPRLATSDQPAPLPSQLDDHASQNSERKPGAEYRFAASGNKPTTSDSSEAQSVELTKVVLAAQTHSEASVSSPTVRFYSPDTELQVVRREGVWIQVSDPVTRERGWVLQQYVASVDDPTPTQVTTESTTGPLTVKPASSNKRHHRSAKHSVRDHVVVATVDPWNARWARRADRRRGFGLFMFRPFGRFAAR
jgi:hypothetical protein